jgi:hypothetical protein
MLQRIILLGLSTSALLTAASVGINMNKDILEVETVFNLKKLNNEETRGTTYQLDFNYMDNEDEPKSFFGVGMGVTNIVNGMEDVSLTFGTKYIRGDVDEDEDFSALPLMVKARYDLSSLVSVIPSVSVELKALYAPEVLSFGESKEYSEFRISADAELINNVVIYGGYRNIRTDFEGITDKSFDNSLYAGLKFIY